MFINVHKFDLMIILIFHYKKQNICYLQNKHEHEHEQTNKQNELWKHHRSRETCGKETRLSSPQAQQDQEGIQASGGSLRMPEHLEGTAILLHQEEGRDKVWHLRRKGA